MKKSACVLLVVLLFCCNCVYALGIRPAKIEINFVSGEKNTFNFQPIMDGDVSTINISAEGDFTEFVTFDKTLLKPGEQVSVTLQFPDKIDKPGNYKLYIAATEIVSGKGVIGSRAKVRGVIKIFVPYKGKYIEPALRVPNGNVNEKINVELSLNNKGTDDALVTPSILFFDSFGKKIETFSFDAVTIKSFDIQSFSRQLETNGWKPARYYAETDISYDGPRINANATFNIGSLFINVTNYTQKIVKEGIQKFYIHIKNGWNGDLDEIYADVNVSGAGGWLVFRTPSANLPAWADAKLEGFIDTSGLEIGSYDNEITLYYSGKKTIVKGKLEIIKGGVLSGYMWIVLIGIVLVLAIVTVNLWRRSQNEQKIKKISR